jgi:hypothetical protein
MPAGEASHPLLKLPRNLLASRGGGSPRRNQMFGEVVQWHDNQLDAPLFQNAKHPAHPTLISDAGGMMRRFDLSQRPQKVH